VSATVSAAGEIVRRSEIVRFTGAAGDPVWVVSITGS